MHPFVHARQHPDKPAIIMATSGVKVTYGELEERSNKGAHLFRAIGLKAGDHICIYYENSSTFLEIAWSAQRSGLFYTCIATHLVPSEVAFIVTDSGSKVLISSYDIDESLRQEIGSCLIFSPNSRNYLEERDSFPATRIDDESPGLDMLYSSGTTGRPKGIKATLPSGSIDQPSLLLNFIVNRYKLNEKSVYLTPAPLYHSAPLRFSMIAQRLGATCVIMEKFDAEQVLQLVETYSVTHAQFVPTHFARMLKLPDEVRANYDLSSLHVVIHAAAPCPVGVKTQVMNWLGPILHEYYAGTEMNGLTAIGPDEWLAKPGSVGKAVWGELRICDADGEPLPGGEIGTIFFANGPSFQYHNDEEKTLSAVNQHGWTTLGDIGWTDQEGYLYLTDRHSFMIISGGVNIYPQEIEDVLAEHPGVVDVAVVGAPNPEMGEEVVAVIQPVQWGDAGPELAQEILDYAKTKLSRVKCPKRIDFDPALPRSAAGKLIKRLVRDRYW